MCSNCTYSFFGSIALCQVDKGFDDEHEDVDNHVGRRAPAKGAAASSGDGACHATHRQENWGRPVAGGMQNIEDDRWYGSIAVGSVVVYNETVRSVCGVRVQNYP